MNTQGVISEVGNVELRRLTARLIRGENLARSEAANFLNELLSPPATDAQVAAALALLAAKGETVEELAGMAEAMRDRAIQLRSRHARFIDTAGPGSSRAKTFNVSTAAVFVIAGAGLPAAKHGSRAATSHAEVLTCSRHWALTLLPHQKRSALLQRARDCFIFAPSFTGQPLASLIFGANWPPHHLQSAASSTNPLARRFRLSAWHPSLLERIASALSLLGVEKAWVVHGADGLDEITITDKTFVAACSSKRSVKPSRFRLRILD
jgi:anthranilate phosphoribosyltransferase